MKWVRPFITEQLVLALIYGFVRGLIEPVLFTGIAAAGVGWWYYKRDQDKKQGG